MSKFNVAKQTTENLKGLLNANYNLADKSMKDRIVYASKHSATRADLMSLVKELAESLGEKFITVPVMAETKKTAEVKTEAPKEALKSTPKGKKSAPKAETLLKKPEKKVDKTEEKAEEKTEQPNEETKKGAKKSAPKKSAEKKADGVEVLAESSKASQQRASRFPDSITVGTSDDTTTYNKVKDIKNLADFKKAFEDERDIVVAWYYPKRNLKQFGYFNNYLGTPKSFPNDMDITMPVFISDRMVDGKPAPQVAYVVSLYTEAPYTMLPDDFEEVDGIKIAGSIEFELYEAVASK